MSSFYDENAAMQRCIHDTLLEIRDDLRQIAAAPAEPRVWGAWCARYKYWLMTLDGRLISHPSERMMKANILHVGDEVVKWESREIGPDGLPVPENESK